MMARTARVFALLLLGTGLAVILGCSAATLLAYTGGGLPPGEPDLGGIVVAAVDDGAVTAASVDAQQATEPIEGASVTLLRGRNVVGRATTGEGGYFRFERPDTGSYDLQVTPPASRPDLRPVERTVSHVRNRRTFVTIELPRAQQTDAPGPGPQR